MGDLEERIETISQERSELERARAEVLEAIGRSAYAQRSGLPIGPDDPAVAAVRDAEERLKGIELRISGREEARRREEGIEQEIANTRSRIEAIEEELDPLFEAIGRSAFAVFQDNPFIDPPYAELFQELNEEVQALEELEHELAEEEHDIEGKPFLDRMLARGKITWLRSRKQSREHSIEKLQRKVGKRVVETDFGDVVEDAGLNAATRPYEQQHQRIETLREQMRSLEADLRHHQAEMQDGSLGADSPDSLRDRKRKHEEELSDAYRSLGQHVLKKMGKGDIPPALSQETETAAQLNREIGAKSREEKRLKALVRKRELEEEAADIGRRIEELKAEVGNLESRREDVQREIAELSGSSAKKASSGRKKDA